MSRCSSSIVINMLTTVIMSSGVDNITAVTARSSLHHRAQLVVTAMCYLIGRQGNPQFSDPYRRSVGRLMKWLGEVFTSSRHQIANCTAIRWVGGGMPRSTYHCLWSILQFSSQWLLKIWRQIAAVIWPGCDIVWEHSYHPLYSLTTTRHFRLSFPFKIMLFHFNLLKNETVLYAKVAKSFCFRFGV